MSNELLSPLQVSVGNKLIDAIFTRGDTHKLDLTFTDQEGQPEALDLFASLKWAIARTLEEKDDKIANGFGEILDDGIDPLLKGKAEIIIDLSGVSDDEIDHLRNYAISFTFIGSSGEQITFGSFRVPIKQDLN